MHKHTHTHIRLTRSIAIGALLLSLLFQTACGTLLHPERRGQTGGRIDPGIAILDGLGLLLFVIPGIVAFAVDFSNGTIYLPPDEADADDQPNVVRVDPAQLNREKLAAVIQKHTGTDITLTERDMRMLRADDPAAIKRKVAAQQHIIRTDADRDQP